MSAVDVMMDGGLVTADELAVRWKAPAGRDPRTRSRWVLRRLDELGVRAVFREGRQARYRFTDILRAEERRAAR